MGEVIDLDLGKRGGRQYESIADSSQLLLRLVDHVITQGNSDFSQIAGRRIKEMVMCREEGVVLFLLIFTDMAGALYEVGSAGMRLAFFQQITPEFFITFRHCQKRACIARGEFDPDRVHRDKVRHMFLGLWDKAGTSLYDKNEWVALATVLQTLGYDT